MIEGDFKSDFQNRLNKNIQKISIIPGLKRFGTDGVSQVLRSYEEQTPLSRTMYERNKTAGKHRSVNVFQTGYFDDSVYLFFYDYCFGNDYSGRRP